MYLVACNQLQEAATDINRIKTRYCIKSVGGRQKKMI